MTNFNYDNYDDDTKAKYDDGIEFLDDDFSFDEDDDDEMGHGHGHGGGGGNHMPPNKMMSLLLHIIIKKNRKLLDRKY